MSSHCVDFNNKRINNHQAQAAYITVYTLFLQYVSIQYGHLQANNIKFMHSIVDNCIKMY